MALETDVTNYEMLEGKNHLKSCLLLKVIILVFFSKQALWLTNRLRNADQEHSEYKWTWTCDSVTRKQPNHR